MSFLTVDVKELKERWMKLYLAIMMLKSNHAKAKQILETFKLKMAEFNSDAMQFFDDLEEQA